MSNLKNKTLFITGASRGIGNARPPAFSKSSAASNIVPGSFGWGSEDLAAMTTLAPS
jgi:NADP-dependent 3-hydroxy acid dehydrogenase YdfG